MTSVHTLYNKVLSISDLDNENQNLSGYFFPTSEVLVKVLTSEYNPAGRLPNTWPASLEQVYSKWTNSTIPLPKWQLVGTSRKLITRGNSVKVCKLIMQFYNYLSAAIFRVLMCT